MRLGYFLSSEEFDPREQIRQARMAEEQIGPDQERFFEIYANEILPRFNDGSAASTLTSTAA